MKSIIHPTRLEPVALRRELPLLLLAGLSLAMGIRSATAAAVIWTHGGEGWEWHNRTNWSTFAVPTVDDNVYITNNASFAVNIDTNGGFNSLTVGGTSHAIVVPANVPPRLFRVRQP